MCIRDRDCRYSAEVQQNELRITALSCVSLTKSYDCFFGFGISILWLVSSEINCKLYTEGYSDWRTTMQLFTERPSRQFELLLFKFANSMKVVGILMMTNE